VRFVSITVGISLVAESHNQYSPTSQWVKRNQLTSCQTTLKRESSVKVETVGITVNDTVTELKGANRGIEGN